MKALLTIFILVTYLTSCNIIPDKTEVVVTGYDFIVDRNTVTMTADCGDLKDIRIPDPSDAIRIIAGITKKMKVTGILYDYGEHRAIERVVLK